MLEVENLEVLYEELRALQGVSFRIPDGSLAALIGSNGAGKTTLLNAISGLVAVRRGQVRWQGEPIVGQLPDEICRRGIIQVPEGRKLFARMTVEENLAMGAYSPGARQKAAESRERSYALFPRLSQRRRQMAGSLSGGEQQMLALARAIMAQPKLLMLDEPSLGLAPIAADEIFRVVRSLNAEGLTTLLVSQEVLQALKIARQAYVLENGRITLEGPAGALLTDQRVKESYLGV